MSLRFVMVILSCCFLLSLADAKGKKKNLLPDYVLKAETAYVAMSGSPILDTR